MARRETPALFEKAQARFRAARFRQVQTLIERLVLRHGEITVLDAGGRAEYWNMLTPALAEKVQLTILNYSSELEDYSALTAPHVRYENLTGDACNMPQFADGAFHLVHSNSVIEHVGNYTRMIAFANEIRRVGQAYYVQTPNFWFPIDPHNAFPLLHWLPDPIRIGMEQRFDIGLARRTDFAGAVNRLDDCRMISQGMMRTLFPDANHSAERFALIFKKSLIARRTD
ncbi:class I SAM-dependent methyltransferase [Porphyrobacter sp. ULC335]|uniref:class I SAM-dependent methyltransferase n=1 Tax=Porphyrobacter sp. ULC335 TaxID=2854260 RepID=UPI00221EF0AB|nr:class I SAM-dependent methyltransferase [Porphyrobacter sp. ULC335]UYV15864.1 class I SAM-dependent methyltransferase [Porphyrobacter sp. ULC335]